jgi:hypothetical protein
MNAAKSMFRHFLFYQHNVQRFFLSHIDKYGGVIVPLSIAVSFQVGTHGFLRALLSKDMKKVFALDPRATLFQRDWNRKLVRDPHKRMAEVFGEPFTTIGLKRALQTNDLAKPELKAFTQNCIDYQKNFRTLEEAEKKLAKYKKLLGTDVLPAITNPQWFIPPYFLFSTQNDAWYGISVECARAAIDFVDANEVAPVLHFSKWSAIKDWNALIAPYAEMGIKKLFVYPNNFREHEQTADELKAYVNAIRAIALAGLDPYSLHGGYFAMALDKCGLRGFGNGIGYGEWRDSNYHRGGTALPRIYLPKLHRFLDPARAQSLVNRDPEYFGADSELIEECLKTNRPLGGVSANEALEHFMECRDDELAFVESHDLDDVRNELATTISRLKELGGLERDEYSPSLQAWKEALAPPLPQGGILGGTW